jgi:hypothetical protein
MSPQQRDTAEQVIVLLAMAVFIVIVVLTTGLVLNAFFGNDTDSTRLVNWLTSIIDTILGALIGFVAGNRIARNGK